MQNHPKPELTTLRLPLASNFINKGLRSQFLKAKIVDSKVELLDGQSSAMLSTFAVADALVYIPSEISQISVGKMVEVHLVT
jgi:molybdopterin molybdotransferase